MGLNIHFGNKKIKLEKIRVCKGLDFFFGLMFKRKETANALLFDFEKNTNASFHSLFVFFPFLVLWLDEKNKVIDLRIVKPFKMNIATTKSFQKVVEIPLNNNYTEIIKLLVGNRKV